MLFRSFRVVVGTVWGNVSGEGDGDSWQQQADDLPDVMTANEAAFFLRIHTATLRRRTLDGTIPARKVGAKWRYSKRALYDWLAGDDSES